MQCLHSSNFVSDKKRHLIRTFFVWLIREITGGVFLFSGFVKAIDPWGTIYKFNEYFAAMGLEIWPSLVVVGVFGLSAVEFTVGLFLMCGCFRVSTPRTGLLFMFVMLPLTLWVAWKDPVADCGCFGDALIISNWATFWKNVVLTAMFLYLIRYNKVCRCLISPQLQWLACVTCGAYILGISLYGFLVQPMIDFRGYPVNSLFPGEEVETGDDETPSMIFTYEKNGVKKEFTDVDSLPSADDGWVFVERRTLPSVTVKNYPTPTTEDKSFRIWSEDGEEDITEDIIDTDSRYFLLLLPDLKNLSIASSWRINSLRDWCEQHDIEMIGITGGSRDEIEEWKDLAMASYPIYVADDTSIKELARGNPAIVYLDKGRIRWKSSLWSIEKDDYLSDGVSGDPMGFPHDGKTMLRNMTGLFVVVIVVLIALSLMPSFLQRLSSSFSSMSRKLKRKNNRNI